MILFLVAYTIKRAVLGAPVSNRLILQIYAE
jgi:hypothetical protein